MAHVQQWFMFLTNILHIYCSLTILKVLIFHSLWLIFANFRLLMSDHNLDIGTIYANRMLGPQTHLRIVYGSV